MHNIILNLCSLTIVTIINVHFIFLKYGQVVRENSFIIGIAA